MPTSHPIFTLAFVAAVALVVWNFVRFQRVQREYRFDGEFSGNRYECALGTTDSEGPLKCSIGATPSSLYLMATPGAERQRSMLSWRHSRDFHTVYKCDLQIPLYDLEWREGKMFFKDVIWFENNAKRFYVYVPKEIGEKLLADAGRALPLG